MVVIPRCTSMHYLDWSQHTANLIVLWCHFFNVSKHSGNHPNSITNYANFISSLVDTFTQLNFLHDLHSTVNLTSALSKLPADVRLNWNRHVLSQNIIDPSLRNFAPWLQNFATACRDSFIPFSDTNHNGRSSSSTNARAQGHNSKTPFVKPSSQSSLCPEKKGCVYEGAASISKHFLQ